MGAAATRFVILTASRSGSTVLTRTLRRHPDVHCHGHPFFAQKKRRKWSRLCPDAAFDFDRYAEDPAGFVSAVLDQGFAACRGFKIWPMTGMPETRVAIEALCKDTSVRKIVLHRDNELAAYSSWKLTRANQLQTSEDRADNQIAFDAGEFAAYVKSRQAWFDWRDRLLTGPALRIPYIGLMDTGIRAIAADLGLAPFDFVAIKQKRNSFNILDRFLPADQGRVMRALRDIGREDWVEEAG